MHFLSLSLCVIPSFNVFKISNICCLFRYYSKEVVFSYVFVKSSHFFVPITYELHIIHNSFYLFIMLFENMEYVLKGKKKSN